jgi:Zn-finger nucleic acid-binding protein
VTETAGALRCPSCGAPAAPETTACAFCATPLALVACPSCFGMIFRGTRYCSHCGKQAARKDAPARPERSCPQCRAILHAVAVGSVVLDECRSCGGLWVDAESFRKICSEREEQAVLLGFEKPPGGDVGRPPTQKAYRPCPECRRLMNRVNYAKVSGVVVDICKGHGVFFDRGELQRIVRFLQDGGMERARAREKDDLEDQRARLRQAKIDARLTAGRLPATTDPSRSGEYRGLLEAVRGLLDLLS